MDKKTESHQIKRERNIGFGFGLATGVLGAWVAYGLYSSWAVFNGAKWWEGMMAVGTLGAVVISLLFSTRQIRIDRQQKIKSAMRSLIGRGEEVNKLLGELAVKEVMGGDMQRFIRISQRRIANLLRPSNDLVDKTFNLNLINCADELGYYLQDLEDGVEVEGERLERARKYLLAASKIAKRRWIDMGYHWLGNSHPWSGEHKREGNYFEGLASEKE